MLFFVSGKDLQVMELKEIATIHTDFPEKFGIPRQSGLVKGLRGTILFAPEYRNPDAIRGLEEFSHLWLIWGFSEVKRENWTATVRPPRLGGKSAKGFFPPVLLSVRIRSVFLL